MHVSASVPAWTRAMSMQLPQLSKSTVRVSPIPTGSPLQSLEHVSFWQSGCPQPSLPYRAVTGVGQGEPAGQLPQESLSSFPLQKPHTSLRTSGSVPGAWQVPQLSKKWLSAALVRRLPEQSRLQ
eukprot:Lithocolla_globosa_v1_NODE_1163_length_2820_cov_379.389873.p6 type:complete len:125 gc:universal NODE_1163_length_2820_cov_379.389873:927-1301(+)